MKMRRNLPITIIFCFAMLAAAAVTIIAGRLYHQNGLLFGGKTSDFDEGWKTPGGAAAALPAALNVNENGTAVISNTLPSSIPEGAVLFLRSTYQSLDVRIDGVSIYSWNFQNKAMFVGSFGLSSYIVHIPSSAAGRTIELYLMSNQQGGTITIYGITLGDGLTAAVSLVNSNIGTIALFFVLAVLFVFISAAAFVFRKRTPVRNPTDALNLTAFIALAAVWLITDSNVMLLFTSNVAVTLYCSLFSLILLPVPLLLFLRRFTHRGKKILSITAVLVLLNFLVCLILLVSGVADLVQTLFTSHILELAVCMTVFVLFTIECLRYKRRDMVEILAGLLLLSLFSIASIIAFSLSNPGYSVFLHIGLTLFILSLGIGVIRRGVSDLLRSKGYERLTLSIPCGICRIESFETGTIIFANELYYRMFGYTEHEARRVGFSTSDFTVLPEDLPAMKDIISHQVAAGVTRFETEARHVKKDGEVIWVLARYRVDTTHNGEITLVMIDITDRKCMEEKLRISEEEYRIATRHSSKLIIRLDIQARTTYRQTEIPSVFGVPNVIENIPESIIEAGFVAQDSVEAFRGFYDAIYRGEREGSAVASMLDVNTGEYRWYHYDFTSIFDGTNKPIQAIISFYDITLQRQKELAFQRWQQSFNAIPKSAANYYEYNLTSDFLEHEEGGMIPLVAENIPRKLNDMASYIAERYIYREDVQDWLSFMSRDRILERYAGGLHTDKAEFRRLNGDSPAWTSLSLQLIPDPYSSDVKGYFLLEDIDEQKKAEIYLQERSTLDALTGLLNRITFIEKFNDILNQSSPETQHALIMLDIDNFKTINDTLGHNAGDALLVNIAGKLKYALRSDDLSGRLGGDEFVICLKNMNLGKPLETRVSDLCNLLCDESTWGVSVSASFGIAGFPEDGSTFDELYQKADIALYKAKAQGRGGYAVYDPQLSFDDLSVPVRHS